MRGGHRQDRAPQQRPGELVEHDQLAAAGTDREPVEPDGPVQPVALEPCRVHDEARPPRPPVGGDELGDLPADVDRRDVERGLDGRAVGERVVGERQRRGPRIDDVLVGHDHAAGDARPEVGLQLAHLAGVDHPRVRVAVRRGLALQRREGRRLFVVPRDEHGAGVLDRDAGGGGVGAQQVPSAGDERATRPSPAWRRSPCGGWPCWPCSCLPRDRGEPRAAARRGDGATALGRRRTRRPRRRRRRRRRWVPPDRRPRRSRRSQG